MHLHPVLFYMNQDPMTIVYSPKNELELVMILSVLEGDGISCFVKNNHFGSLKVGPKIDLLNGKWILVQNEYSDRAKELIADYLNSVNSEINLNSSDSSAIDKLRIVAEFLICGWFIPGNSYPPRKRFWLPTLFYLLIILLGGTLYYFLFLAWSR